MKRYLKISYLFLAMTVLLSFVALAFDLRGFKDYDEKHWANTALSEAVDNGLIKGYEDNTIRADKEMTRAEMATIVNRAFGAEVKADVSHFADLKTTDWFYDEIAKAVRMQTFGGTGSGIEATRCIYREEAMTVIARALVLEDGSDEVLSKFSDGNTVSAWAKGPVAVLVSKGYVNGTNMNLIEPRSYVTRAQFAQIMYNIFSDYIQTSGTFSVNAERSLMINVPNVTLRDCTVKGDLVLGDGVGRGYINVTNVKVTGRILIRGGDKVNFKNVTAGEGIVVKNVNGTVNFQNYETEAIFKGIKTFTPVTYLQKTPYVPSTPSGPSTTYYTVIFYNGDGSIMKTQTVASGLSATAPAETPTKAEDNEYTYTFAGWDTDFEVVNSNLEVKPKFNNIDKIYTITLTYGDGTTGTMPSTIEVKWNNLLVDFLPDENDIQNGNKIFDGWYNGSEKIDTEKYSDIAPSLALTAKWTDKFTVIFYNGDGTVMKTEHVAPGGSATEPAETPTKAEDNEYTYTFAGWDTDGDEIKDEGYKSVSSNLDVKPIFGKTEKTYTIHVNYVYSVLFENTAARVENITVKYNQLIKPELPYSGFSIAQHTVPSKDFDGWMAGATLIDDTTTYADIKGTIEITANWVDVFKVIFYNGDGSVLETQTVRKGESATNPTETPTKATDNEFRYTFNGKWDSDGDEVADEGYLNVTSNMTVKPLFDTEDVIYTITLNYGDGTTGTMPSTIDVKWNDTLADKLPDENDIQNGNKIFDGWYNGSEKIDTEKYSDIAPSLALTAKWTDTYTVIFYGWDDDKREFKEIGRESNLKAGDTVSALPTYIEKQYGYKTGGGATHDATNDVYSEPYVHEILSTWSYKDAGELEEFTLETEVYSDLDVYPAFKRIRLDVFIKRYEGTVKGEFAFVGYYDNSRIVDSLKDLMWNNKTLVLNLVEATGGEEKLLQKLHEKGLIDTNRKIYNQDARIKLVTLIGDENLDDFVKTEAEKNVTEDNMTAFLRDYIHDNPDEATELLLDFLHLATQDDIDTIFKPAVKTFLEKDPHLLEEELRIYIDSLTNDDIKELIKSETDIVKQFIKDNPDLVESYVNNTSDEQIRTFISDNKDTLRSEIDTFLTDDFIEAQLRAYIAEEYTKGNYTALNELLGVDKGLYSSTMKVSHATIVQNFEAVFSANKNNIVSKLWEDKSYIETLLLGDLYVNVVVSEVMAELDRLISAGDYSSFNALIDKVDTSVSDIDASSAYLYHSGDAGLGIAPLRGEIESTLKSFTAGSTERRTIVNEIMSKVTKSDIETYVSVTYAKNYVNGLYADGNYTALNAFFGTASGIYSADMSLLGGYDTVTNTIVTTVKGDAVLKGEVIDFIYGNEVYFGKALDKALADPDFVEKAVEKAVDNDVFLTSIMNTSVASDAIDEIIATRYDDSPNDFEEAVDSVITTMTKAENKDATIDKIMGILFDGSHGDQLDRAVDIVVHDIANSTDSNVLSLIEEFSGDVILYLEKHPDKKEILVELVVEELYSDTIDLFTKQLREEEKFTVHDSFSSLIAMAMYNKYNGMTLEGFMEEVNLPESFDKVLSNEAIKDILENLYNKALQPYLAQLKDAHDNYESDPDNAKGTYEVDTFVTVKVDPIDDLVNPLYDEFRRILDEKIDDKHVYADNPYAVELVNLLAPEYLLNKMAAGYDEEIYSGYTIPTAEELYTLVYTVAVLADDAGKWYLERIDKDKVDAVIDRLEDNILEYVNCIIGFVNEYSESGEIPNLDSLPDSKLDELLEKYDIQGIIDRNEKIQAIIEKITANEKFNTVIDKFVNSKLNRPLTGEDYDKAKSVLDFFFRNYNNDDWNLDEVFDKLLIKEIFDKVRVDGDTYEIEFRENTATLTRDMFIDGITLN